MGKGSGWRRASVVACVAVAVAVAAIATGARAVQLDAMQSQPQPPSQNDAAPAKPLRPNPEFARLPRYEGTLGGRPIVVRLGPKDDEPGVHGEYQFRDTGEVVLLAGDRDGDTLEIEESDDGTNITGVWVGRFDASGGLTADRMNADESDPQPVVLKAVAPPRAALQVREDGVRPLRTVSGIVDLRTGD